jgi:hypothetical protein
MTPGASNHPFLANSTDEVGWTIAEGGKSSTPLTNTQLSGLITPSMGQKGTLDYRMFFEHADKGRVSPWCALLCTASPRRASKHPMFARMPVFARCQAADESSHHQHMLYLLYLWAQARRPAEHIRLQRLDSVQLLVRDPQVDSRQVRGESTRTHCLSSNSHTAPHSLATHPC